MDRKQMSAASFSTEERAGIFCAVYLILQPSFSVSVVLLHYAEKCCLFFL